MNYAGFQKTVWAYYAAHKRTMPWREQPTPYYVLVSEVMLQQTQVPRVVPKFEAFIQAFPTISVLANAPLGAVLKVWNGLGYNRRAKYLWQAAGQSGGRLQPDLAWLTKLPGIGPNTAGAILAYVFNQPAVFVETNIRTVFIHHFFANQTAVADAEIKKLVAATLPKANVREWYWALMDYGAHLKATTGSSLQRAAAHKKQTKFAGSTRQLRGRIIKALIGGSLTHEQLLQQAADDRAPEVITDLLSEGLIKQRGKHYSI